MNHKSDTMPPQNVRRIKLLYVRCSSATQNMDRQLVDKDKFDIVVEEYASVLIPFAQREGGSRILQLIEKAKKDKEFKLDPYVYSLERLGRNLKDLTNVFSQCSDAGVGNICEAGLILLISLLPCKQN